MRGMPRGSKLKAAICVSCAGEICYRVPVPNLSSPLARKDAVVIASRVLTVYFLTWVVSELIYLPSDIYSTHFFVVWAAHTGSPYDAHLRASAIGLLCQHVIRVSLAFLAAGWAYRCGPGIAGFLFPESNEVGGES